MMNSAHESPSTVEQDLILQAIDRETQAVLGSVLGGFLEIDLQFKPVLDGFTGGNVFTYLSREADRMADALFEATGRPIPPIDAGRQWAIEPGGLRPAAVMIEDFVESATRLQEAAAGVGDWSSLSADIRELPVRRLVQLVVHHADLERSWESVSDEDAAIAVSHLSSVMAVELAHVRVVVEPGQPLATIDADGATVLTGDARAILAWVSGRQDGVDPASTVDLSAPARRIWF